MSMFKAIKGTILNVQQDLSSSFRSLTTRESVTEEPVETQEDGIYLDAGAGLLDNFQTKWASIHSSSEENAKCAQKCDSQINELFLYLERQNDAMNQFYTEVSSLPKLVDDLRIVMDKIGDLEGLFTDIERDLAELNDISDELELHNDKVHHQKQLRLYRQRKNLDLEQTKVKLASRHAEKVSKYEAKLQGTLREKQQAFEAAYKEEMDRYKKYGQTDFKPSPQPKHKVTLEDINIDEDSSALDEFLDTSESNITPITGENLEHSDDVTAKGDADSEGQVDVTKVTDDTADHEPTSDSGSGDPLSAQTVTPGNPEPDAQDQTSKSEEVKPTIDSQ